MTIVLILEKFIQWGLRGRVEGRGVGRRVAVKARTKAERAGRRAAQCQVLSKSPLHMPVFAAYGSGGVWAEVCSRMRSDIFRRSLYHARGFGGGGGGGGGGKEPEDGFGVCGNRVFFFFL